MTKIVNKVPINVGDYVVIADSGKGFLISYDASGNPTVTLLDKATIDALCKEEGDLFDGCATICDRPVVMRAKCA